MKREELLKDAKPFRFNTEEIRALLREPNPKTVTRRAVKGFIPEDARFLCTIYTPEGYISCKGKFANGYEEKFFKLPCQPGDILYVRERFCKGSIEYGEEPDGSAAPYVSQCVGDSDIIPYEYCIRENIGIADVIWCPSIHMPKEAARIFLRVTDVRVERLQDITPEQIIAEGITEFDSELLELLEEHYEIPFAFLWDKTIPKKDFEKYRWQANPWVWVVEFERVMADENVN